jgi:hypothetical protein
MSSNPSSTKKKSLNLKPFVNIGHQSNASLGTSALNPGLVSDSNYSICSYLTLRIKKIYIKQAALSEIVSHTQVMGVF